MLVAADNENGEGPSQLTRLILLSLGRVISLLHERRVSARTKNRRGLIIKSELPGSIRMVQE